MPAPLIKPLTADDIIEALRLRYKDDAVGGQLLDHLEQAIGVSS